MKMWTHRLPSSAASSVAAAVSFHYRLRNLIHIQFYMPLSSLPQSLPLNFCFSSNIAFTSSFCSRIHHRAQASTDFTHLTTYSEHSSRTQGPLEPGLYLVGTPIGNLEDITLRAIRILNSADVILSEDTRHSGKLLHHFNIKTPLLSYHKFNESQRGQAVLKRLKEGEVVALISDAGTPGISDPGAELTKLCVEENIPVVPVPGPCALVSALSASGLSTNEFTFVGFLPKHSSSRRKRLMLAANESTTQIFYVPPHKLLQFLEESFSCFGDSRQCVIAREMTKLHEEFWRGTLGEAKEVFSKHQPKGELTVLIQGRNDSESEVPSEHQLENDLTNLISSGHSLSEAVKLVSSKASVRKKTIYSLALRKFGKQLQPEDDMNR